MENSKVYGPSPANVYILITGSIGFFLWALWFILFAKAWQMAVFICPVAVGCFLLGLYYQRKIKAGKGYYWDEKGLVNNMGKKPQYFYWSEIKRIGYETGKNACLILYFFDNKQADVQKRFGWKKPRKNYPLDISTITKSNEFRDELMKVYKEVWGNGANKSS